MKKVMGVVCLSIGMIAACSGESTPEGAAELTAAAAAVGTPCTIDEERADFAGYSVTEVNVDDHNAACGDGVCVVHNFQGRAGCPYGQAADAGDCATPDGSQVSVEVLPQLVSRAPGEVAHCSCRCDGPGDGPFCACPGGFECRELIDDLGVDPGGLAGSYCVRSGTYVLDDPSAVDGTVCDAEAASCQGR